MAQLRMTINGVSASRAIDDAKAAAISELFYKGFVVPNWPADKPLPATPQEKLQAVVDGLALHMRDLARGYRRREIEQEREQAEKDELAGIDV